MMDTVKPNRSISEIISVHFTNLVLFGNDCRWTCIIGVPAPHDPPKQTLLSLIIFNIKIYPVVSI